jgi:hypothetical protein
MQLDQATALLQGHGLRADEFRFAVKEFATPLPVHGVTHTAIVRCGLDLCCTYWSDASGQSWLQQFADDIKAGRFTTARPARKSFASPVSFESLRIDWRAADAVA